MAISSETREALSAIEIPSAWRGKLEEGLGKTEAALAGEDTPEALADGLDLISLAVLRRTGDSGIAVPAAVLFRDLLASLWPEEEAELIPVPPALSRRRWFFPSWTKVKTPQSLAPSNWKRRAFLNWWYDAWLAHLGREQIRAYIQSPFHYPPEEDRVRAITRDQMRVYRTSAKRKLRTKLKEEKAEAAKAAKRLRDEGRGTEADRLEWQVRAYEWALDEIDRALS